MYTKKFSLLRWRGLTVPHTMGIQQLEALGPRHLKSERLKSGAKKPNFWVIGVEKMLQALPIQPISQIKTSPDALQPSIMSKQSHPRGRLVVVRSEKRVLTPPHARIQQSEHG